MPRLIILTRGRSARQVQVSGSKTTICRNEANSLVVDRERVSRNHAVIDWNGHQYSITDIGSRNGTYVNGMRVMQRRLRNGDTITIGDCDLRFLARSPTRFASSLFLERWLTSTQLQWLCGGSPLTTGRPHMGCPIKCGRW